MCHFTVAVVMKGAGLCVVTLVNPVCQRACQWQKKPKQQQEYRKFNKTKFKERRERTRGR